jgi:hypothetical protein
LNAQSEQAFALGEQGMSPEEIKARMDGPPPGYYPPY